MSIFRRKIGRGSLMCLRIFLKGNLRRLKPFFSVLIDGTLQRLVRKSKISAENWEYLKEGEFKFG